MFSEPISGSAPKFTINSKLSLVERKLAEPLTLVCPAQGSPVPGYRSASNFSSSLVNTSPRQWKVHPPSCFEHSEANCQPACLLLPVSPLTLNFERQKTLPPCSPAQGNPTRSISASNNFVLQNRLVDQLQSFRKKVPDLF